MRPRCWFGWAVVVRLIDRFLKLVAEVVVGLIVLMLDMHGAQRRFQVQLETEE